MPFSNKRALSPANYPKTARMYYDRDRGRITDEANNSMNLFLAVAIIENDETRNIEAILCWERLNFCTSFAV